MGKKILFLSLHRPNRSPSQRYRFEQYIPHLVSQGYKCEHFYLLNEKDDKNYYAPGKLIYKGLILIKSTIKLWKELLLGQYDIVFVQRECYMLGTAFFEKRFARKAKFVFDFDDAIWMEQSGEIRSANKSLRFLKDPAKTIDIIKASHVVIAGNEYLHNFALRYSDRVHIIPSTVDTDLYKRETSESSDKPVCIGWSGSFSTVIHFQTILNALYRVKEKYKNKVSFKVIGDTTFEDTTLGVKGEEWTLNTELKNLSMVDIGLMPLPDDKWTKGKCGMKGLIYMSMEIPAIMSPVGVNNQIINHGVNGYLASSDDDWVEYISKLIDSADLRFKLGKAGRQTVIDQYSVESQKKEYLELFNSIA